MNPVSPSGRELFIGLVAAVGTDLNRVSELLTEILRDYDYSTEVIRLADLLKEVTEPSLLKRSPADDYIESHMDAGDAFRRDSTRGDALTVLALRKVAESRLSQKSVTRKAFVFRSLKHPAEIETLRAIYGDSLHIIAVSASHDKRRQSLAARIAASRGESPPERFFSTAENLIWRDQSAVNNRLGQQVSDAFHRADFFANSADESELRGSLERYISLIFGETLETPTRAEYSMFMAKAAALRSSELGRQVGACITTFEGDVIALGTNEVPKAHGGLYWVGDKPDQRQFQNGSDSNDDNKRSLILDTLTRLRDAGWLAPALQKKSSDDLADDAMKREGGVFPKDSRVQNLIEFGRAVHGEMAALTDAARRGVSVSGCVMYVTTFPCHLCARHVVAAGIRQLFYIEPYAKSLTAELYPDSISVESTTSANCVIFSPFVGVAPRQYLRLFEATNRKNSTTGKVIRLDKKTAVLRYSGAESVYQDHESTFLKTLLDSLASAKKEHPYDIH